MRKLLLTSLTLIVVLAATAQKSKKSQAPTPTSVESRWQGFLQRQNLQTNSLVKNIPFRNVGPTIMSGRVVDLDVDPNDPTHFFVAYASGGLWETTNEGASFTPLFDQEIVMTIGDIAVDYERDILYIGSGENNSSRSSYSGYGLFKSTDHGKTWINLGLKDSHHIGRVILHPNDPNTIWVASLGHLYSENQERGVYKSTDGGKTWERTLFVNPRTGIIELVINPNNPDELMAAAWEKDRKAWNFEESGEGSAIFKSTDGGNTWVVISGGNSGFPDTKGTGRIGIAYAPSATGTIYAMLDNQDTRPETEKEASEALTRDMLRTMDKATFEALDNDAINGFLDDEYFPREINAVDLKKDVKSGKVKPNDLVVYLEDANALLFTTPIKGAEVYKSVDNGVTWNKTHEGYIDALVNTYGYYFGQIRVDALDPNILYTVGVPLIKSMDGGQTWEITNMENVHADHHALWVNPNRSGHLINGNDGGVNISYDYGKTWVKCNSTPVGQFYSVNVDLAEPYNVFGGLQDNGVWKGPSTYEYSYSWYEEGKYPYERIMGGDGMQVAIDTRTNDIVYTGYQFGNYYRLNTTTGDRKYITPKHELGEAPYRWNWQAPIVLSSHNQDIVYFGSNRLHRSMNQGEKFENLSGDLTNGGKKGDVSYGTLTSISESPFRLGLIYTGSDDGLVHVTKDGGLNWQNISKGLPQDFWVSRVVASAHKEGRVYVTLNGYRWDQFEAMVYVSDNYGTSWKKIGTDLPAEPVNVIREDPKDEKILYVGTDHGAYVSIDGGINFMAFGNLPAVAVHDLVIHPTAHDLVLGTHGRSIYIGNIAPIRTLAAHGTELMVFNIGELTYSERWGNKGNWHWAGFSEPSCSMTLIAPQNGSVTIEIAQDDQVLKTFNMDVNQGINLATYDLTTDKTEETTARENGKNYLKAGKYNVKVTMGDQSTSGTLNIKAPRERPKRKGSE